MSPSLIIQSTIRELFLVVVIEPDADVASVSGWFSSTSVPIIVV